MDTSIADKVIEQLAAKPEPLQWRVLEFACALAQSPPREVPGRRLLHLAGTISPEDTEQMHEAIEEGCEREGAPDDA